MSDDDAELVALIDNELDESRRTALVARLAADDRLRQRYEELRQTGAPLAASLEALLGEAPLARLRAALPGDEPLRQPSRRFAGIALRELAAGVVIGLLAAGAIAWVASIFGAGGGEENWRSAVAQYTDLYTRETFAPLNPDPGLQAAELNALGAKIGASLTPENIALPGLQFTTAFILAYEGHPLGVIAYVDPSGARSCSAFSLVARRTRRRVRSAAAICRWLGGRAAGAAIWLSAASPRSRRQPWRRRSKSECDFSARSSSPWLMKPSAPRASS